MAESERKEGESSNPLVCVAKCICAEIKQRCSQSPDAKKQFGELLEESIPVLVAAAASGFVTTLIEYISEDSEYKEASQCGQAIVYAVLAYFVGYFLTIKLKQQLETKNSRSSLVEWIEKQELTEVLFGFFAENSAFAWREFINIFVLKIVYLNYGFGPSLGTWFLCFTIFCILMCCSIFILQSNLVSKDLQNLLLEFNSDAFSFPLAFSITVLIALGFTQIGANYTDSHGYLYEWKDDDSNEHDDSADSNSYYNLYAIIVTILVALILVIEDRCCWSVHSNELEMELEFNNPRMSQDRNDRTVAVIPQGKQSERGGNVTYQATLELWHNLLG
jgi:hypothetical protein